MRKILVITIALLSAMANAQTQAQLLGINGTVKEVSDKPIKVKMIEQRAFDVVSASGKNMPGNVIKDPLNCNCVINFDTTGKISGITALDLKGNAAGAINGLTFNEVEQFDTTSGLAAPQEITATPDKGRIVNTFDENKLSVRRQEDKNSKLVSVETIKYDKAGNITEMQRYVAKTKKTTTIKYGYQWDKNRNWTRKTIYSENKPIRIIVRKIAYH